MNKYDVLKKEFHAEDDSFLIKVRCDLEWDWDAFYRLVSTMYQIATELKDSESLPKWIAEGFWYCESFIPSWTLHENFPKPEEKAHENALEILSHLSCYLFTGESPLLGDGLEKMIELSNPRL